MTAEIAAAANAIVSVAYFAITFAILTPLARAGQLGRNRLGTATAAIFFSCAVGHAFHGLHSLSLTVGSTVHSVPWYSAWWDLLTAGIGVYYWTLRRAYGALLESPTLFDDLDQRQRLAELEHQSSLADARRQAERERDAHAGMLSAVIANSQSLIYVKDLQGRYLLVNKQFEDAFSVTEAEMLGHTNAALDPVNAQTWQASDMAAQVGRITVEEQIDDALGHHEYESVKFPLYDADGIVYAVCGISLDVTAQRRADLLMAQARDAALASTAAKSAFLATMSHEIRTPMNAVIGMTGLLLDTDLDEQQRDFVETVRNSGDALLVVINDILDFSKIEAGELSLEHEPFDLRACAESSMDLIAQAAGAKGLDLVLQMAEDCPQRVFGDSARLRQVLVNLLSNAVKFTEVGDVLVTVTADVQNDEAKLRITVQDTGIGIPSDRMHRLFQSFSQVDASTTRLYGGTGLGLAISRRLVHAMGGELTAESDVGRGSTFTATVTTTIADAGPVEPSVFASIVGRSVLIVDDNATNRRMLQRQLSAWGLETTSAAEPHEALALVRAGARYDAAVLDMHMPGMDGQELARELRALPTARDLPLVMLTSVGRSPAQDGDVEYAAYLTKPARLTALRAAMLRALSDGTPPVEARDEPPEAAGRPAATPLRVLLAEDNTVNQKVGRLMLATLGHEVDTVSNGLEAVAAVRATKYDVVLMDVHMPHLDGLDATRAIRTELPADRQPYIVAVTASVMLHDQEECTRAGMDAHLAKPVRREQLEALLTALGPSRVRPMTFDTGVIDALVESVGGDADMRTELLTSYLAEADERFADLAAGARVGDRALILRTAHTMRSSSRMIGLISLSEMLERLESAVKGPAAVDAMVDQALAEYQLARAGVVAALASSEASPEPAST